jgi:uncharacterized protein (DUF952 family)
VSEGAHYLHLTPLEVWRRQADGGEYRPEAFEADGFIHLTIGAGNLIAVGNRYYRGDPRDYVALQIDPESISAPVRFDDDSGIYPHVYGPLNPDAVREVRPVHRAQDGTFVRIDGER